MAALLVASSSELICKFFSFFNYSPRENLLKYVDLNEISIKIHKKNNIYFKCFFIIEKKVKNVFHAIKSVGEESNTKKVGGRRAKWDT